MSEKEKKLLKIIAALLFGMYRRWSSGEPWAYHKDYALYSLKVAKLDEEDKNYVIRIMDKISDVLKQAYETGDKETLKEWIIEIALDLD